MDFENKLKKILNEVGLTEIQSEIYLFILKSGGSAVSKIASTLNINRTNTYNIIEKLKSLDLVWEQISSNSKIIYAKSYESLISNLNSKQERLTEYKKEIDKFMPVFDSYISKVHERPRIKTYEGAKALEEITHNIIDLTEKNSEILLFTNQDSEKYIFDKEKHDFFIQKRIDKKIFIKVLSVNNKGGQDLKKLDKNNLRETRFLPENFKFESELYIYENKICLIDLKNTVIGTIIESTELFNLHKQIFEMLWEAEIMIND